MTRGVPGYFSSVNPDLLRRVPLTADCVLEVGSGDGALGRRFKMRNPQTQWLAIEVDANAARTAAGVLDDVLHADVERLGEAELDAFLAGRTPDVLVFGDVLEHLREPEAALARLVDRLAPGGAVVACIPNIGHWSVVRDLLAGRWTYADSGLLDRTHLRFFTLDSAVALLRGAGLEVRRSSSRDIPLDAPGQKAFMEALRASPGLLGGQAEAAEARLKALQYVLVAQKPPVTPVLELHQLVMVRQLLEARVDPPWQALATMPGVHATASERQVLRPTPLQGAPRVMVIQRQLVGDLGPWTQFMRRLVADGWLLVAEWDDHPDLLPSPAQENWQRHPWRPMTSVHACQVSTPRLAEVFRRHNPETEVFENAVLDLPPLRPRDPGVVRVLYAAVSRPGVARLISPGLDAVAEDPRVEILVLGDEKVFASTRARRKRYLPLQDYAAYLDVLATVDVNLLPLRGAPAELTKSPLKFIESASRGAVCIASPDIYEDTIRHGETGWLARSQDDWTALMRRVVADDAGRRRMAQSAWETVRERHLQVHQVARREAWYRSLAARKAELDAALFARHPELRP
ncbi:MAG: methyltransferase domain-containing protein [Alsobacter sp.]